MNVLSFISYYSTLATVEAAYVLGGNTNADDDTTKDSTIIAQYFNGQWLHVWDLTRSRSFHRSLMIRNRAFIVGGGTSE